MNTAIEELEVKGKAAKAACHKLAYLYKHIESGEYEDEALVIWSGKQIMSAVENNEKLLRSKALWMTTAYYCLLVEVIASGIFVFSVSA